MPKLIKGKFGLFEFDANRLTLREPGGRVQCYHPLRFSFNNSGTRGSFEMRFDLFIGAPNPNTGGLPIDKFPAVTLYRPLEQMSVEAFLTLISEWRGIIISSRPSVNDQ